MGEAYWLGSPADAQQQMNKIRAEIPEEVHLALILDGRLNRNFSVWVEPWLDHVGSLNPMIYPPLFGPYQSIEAHIDESFGNLERYGLPIVPMLQLAASGGRPSPADITRQGNAAWAPGAAGMSFFRLGSDLWGMDGQPHSGDRELATVAQIETKKVPEEPLDLPYTWQDVINAAVTVSAEGGGDWNQ